MGTVMSLFDGCGPSADTPAAYMEQELQKETRFKKNQKRRRMDIMGVAMESAMKDVKHIVGV